jgi:hypothetical protein
MVNKLLWTVFNSGFLCHNKNLGKGPCFSGICYCVSGKLEKNARAGPEKELFPLLVFSQHSPGTCRQYQGFSYFFSGITPHEIKRFQYTTFFFFINKVKLERLADSRDQLYNVAINATHYPIYVSYVLFIFLHFNPFLCFSFFY